MSRRLQALPVFLSLFLVVALSASDEPVQLSESFGGLQNGTEFSDQATVVAGQTIGSITIRANKRVDSVSLEVLSPSVVTFIHGGCGGMDHVLKLGEREQITSMEVHWGEKNGGKRIFYLSFGTSAGNTISAGSKTPDMQTVTAPEGFQLGGFFGRCGDEIDMLGAIWSRISADAPVADALALNSPHIPTLAPLAGTVGDWMGIPASETPAEESTNKSLTGSADSAVSTSESLPGSADLAESAERSSSGSADSATADPEVSTSESSSASADLAESAERSSSGSADSATADPEVSTSESSSASADLAESAGDSSSGSANSAESTDDSTSGSVGSAESTDDSMSGSVGSAESTNDSMSGSVGSAESTNESSSASADSSESTEDSSSGSADSAESTNDSTSGSMGSAESTEESSSASAN
uniref:Jacalin-type lectin domain-containing protein n=1 Tax=Hyaloperonospora arabidopsidis (strain Emoy2) TaxID=559515 RepID=M4BZ32_HYAAE